MNLGNYLIFCAAVCAVGATAELIAPGGGVLTLLLAIACSAMAVGILAAIAASMWSRSARSKTRRPR